VPQFLPFRGIRYAHDVPLEAVCAPPYDVIESEERAALQARDPRNSIRLILPDTYEGAAAQLRTWLGDGALVVDDAPSFSAYRMTFRDANGASRQTVGVIGALGLEPPDGSILPHERTLPKAKSDRLELLRATRANLDPIWGLSLASGLSGLVDPGHAAPAASAYDDDGVLHELFPVTAPDVVAAIAAAVGSQAVVLADGHHRYETAGNYSAERAAAGISDPAAAAIMALVVELAPDQLWVQAIHRMITGIGDLDLRAALAPWFDVSAQGPNTPDGVVKLESAMDQMGALGLVDRDGFALLVPRPELEQELAAFPGAVRDIDSARFDAGIRGVLGAAELSYRHDAAAVAAHVAKGTCDAGVLLRAVTVDQIRAAAAAGIRMPEKTTFFAPKPRTGMVLRSLDLG
jgi:uncharacterized protein (DUF1015 family)